MTDASNPNKPPEIKDILWNFFVKRIGRRGAVIIFVLIAIIALGVELIPKAADTFTTLRDSFRDQFPANPKFAPSHFSVGVAIYSGDKFDQNFLNALRLRFHGYPDIKFYEVASLPEDFRDKLRLGDSMAENQILDWISATGANGVLWGDKVIVDSDTTLLLKWSRPQVEDMTGSIMSTFSYTPTTTFPSLHSAEAKLLIPLYIKTLLIENNNDLGRRETLFNIPGSEKRAIRDMQDSICDGSQYQKENCHLFNKVRLELHMKNDETDFYFNHDQYADLFYAATGRSLGTMLYPKNPEEFQTYGLAIDYMLGEIQDPSRTEDMMKLLKEWVNIADYRFGLAIERNFPGLQAFHRIMQSQVELLFCLDTVFYKKPQAQKEWPVKEFDKQLKKYESALQEILKNPDVNGYQKAKLSNRLGVNFLKFSWVLKSTGANNALSVANAAKYFDLSIKHLEWYKYRVPRFLASVRLNYARSLLENALSEVRPDYANKAARQIQYAMVTARNLTSYTLEESALRLNAEANSKLAQITKDKRLHCRVIKMMNDASRLRQNLSGIILDDDTSFKRIMIRYYNQASWHDFSMCLKENEYNAETVYEDIKADVKKKR